MHHKARPRRAGVGQRVVVSISRPPKRRASGVRKSGERQYFPSSASARPRQPATSMMRSFARHARFGYAHVTLWLPACLASICAAELRRCLLSPGPIRASLAAPLYQVLRSLASQVPCRAPATRPQTIGLHSELIGDDLCAFSCVASGSRCLQWAWWSCRL